VEDRAPVTKIPSGVTRLVGTDCVGRTDGTHCWEYDDDDRPRLVLSWPADEEVARFGQLCHRRVGEPWSCRTSIPADFASRPFLAGSDDGNVRGCAAEGRRIDCWSGPTSFGLELDAPVTELVYGNSACALANGRLWCWLTYHSAGRRRARAPERIRSIAMDQRSHVCGVLESKRIACWTIEQEREHYRIHAPEELADLENVEQVVAGEDHFCARSTDGRVACWGDLALRGGEPTFVGPTIID
jgi:hypothetical protein